MPVRPQDQEVRPLFRTDEFMHEFGVVKVEEWPEGIVFWAGGQIRWASFRDPEFWNVRRDVK